MYIQMCITQFCLYRKSGKKEWHKQNMLNFFPAAYKLIYMFKGYGVLTWLLIAVNKNPILFLGTDGV